MKGHLIKCDLRTELCPNMTKNYLGRLQNVEMHCITERNMYNSYILDFSIIISVT